MLDQNTDRMWYVIGAVIIGAAIIFILNGTAPELFASVGGIFQDKADDVSEMVETISSDTIIDIPIQEGVDSELSNIVKDGSGTSFTLTHYPTAISSSGAYFYIQDLDLKPDRKYEITYDLQRLSGVAMRPNGYADNNIKIDFYMDAEPTGNSYYAGKSILIDDPLKHHARIVYDMKEDITEHTMYSIQPARYESLVKSGSKEPIVVEISNMRVREVRE